MLCIFISVLILAGCAKSTEIVKKPPAMDTQVVSLPSETPIPLSATPTPTIIPTDSPVPSPAIQIPTETPVQSTPTITALPEHLITSIEEIVGVWKGKWDGYYLQEFSPEGQTRTLYEQYPETVERELYTFENGFLTWSDITYTIGEPQECLDDPVATYEVYITYRGDQPESLRWVLVGEDHCEPRHRLLTLFPYTWFGTSLP
jgi:hypothetical protein